MTDTATCEESWKNLIDDIYKDIYEVSSAGRLRNKKTKIVLRGSTRANGYKYCKLYPGGKSVYIHRLVAAAFIPCNDTNKIQVNHKDKNRENNKVDNLEWVTAKENIVHAVNPRSKAHYQKSVSKYDLTGNFIETYSTVKEAAEKNKTYSSNISSVCQGKAMTAGGLSWKYDCEKEVDLNLLQDIPGNDGYKANPKGGIYSTHIKGYMRPQLAGDYLTVTLTVDQGRLTCLVHRLIAETFIPNPEMKKTVNHKNGDKHDNRVDNLEWSTNAEQSAHYIGKSGKSVTQLDLHRNIIKQYNTATDAARTLNIDSSGISKACKGKQNTAGGFKWRFTVS